MHTATLFDNTPRLNMLDSIRITIETLNEYRERFENWVIAWSGGKNSTATVTLIIYLIDSGKVKAPKKMRVMYADTRMELPPLELSALCIIEELRARGIEVEVVRAPMDKRFLPYILGRGVPPPNNNTLRWCTRQIKVEPMRQATALLGDDWLTITGVRIGESAARDERIVLSCSKDGAECGQGHFFQNLTNTLAPLVHWRVCHVWEWLKHWAPQAEFGDWDTSMLADAYGGDEAEEINARTGCICCPLASKDNALEAIIAMPRWGHLAPLRRLRDLYAEMRSPIHRLRQEGERKKDGSLSKNPTRMGPLSIEARQFFLAKIFDVQLDINTAAHDMCRSPVNFLDSEEIDFIFQCWEDNVWPDGWTGNEPSAALLHDEIYSDGTVQKTLFKD